MNHRIALLGLALLMASASAQFGPRALGRIDGGSPRAVLSLRFVTADVDDILVATDEGTVRVAVAPGRPAQPVYLYRIAVYRQSGDGLALVWRSDPALGTADSSLPGPWAAADIDADGRAELLVFSPDSCLVVEYEADSIMTRMVPMSGAAVEAAAWCNPAGDGNWRLAALEASPVSPTVRTLRFWDWSGTGFEPTGTLSAGFDWGDSVTVHLLGAARLEDYAGTLPVIAGVHRAVRPSTYGIAWSDRPGSLAWTALPFPRRDWFSKSEVLPAGRLALYNVGDTLVGYGYFVPGSRPAGPDRSFAALQDGEWRLLPIAEQATRASGPACPFTRQGRSGWLEARDGLLYYYPDGIFNWR